MQHLLGGRFRQQVGTTLLTQVAGLTLTVATSAIIARWLGPAGKGSLTIAMLAPGIVSLFLGCGLAVANVYFVGSRRFTVAQLARNSVGFALVAALAGTAIILILRATGWLTRLLPGVPPGIATLTLLTFPIGLVAGYLMSILQGLQRIFRINVVNLIQGLLALSAVLVMVVGLEFGLLGGVLAYLIAGVAGLLLFAWFVRREGGDLKPAWERTVLKPQLAFGLRGYVGNVLQFFNYRFDAFLVNFFLGPAGVGIYGVSVALAELLWQFPNAVSFVIFPKAATTHPEIMNTFTPRVFRITLGLTFAGALALAVAGRFLIVLIYGSAFAAAYGPLLALLPGVALLGGAKVLTNEIAGRGFPLYNSIASGLGLVVTVVMDLLLIPKYGVMGASVASSLSYALIFLAAIVFYRIASRHRPLASGTTGAPVYPNASSGGSPRPQGGGPSVG